MSEKKYYILVDSSTRESYGPLSKEDLEKLDIPETMLTCIPKLKTGLKPAKDFPDLTNYVISQDVYTLKKEDKKKKLYIKKGVNRRECSFEEMEAELKEGSIRETTPIGVGSCEKWYYAGNVDGLNLNQKIRLQTKADYPTPEKNKSNQSYTGYDDTPILAFLKQSDRLMEEVKQEVENCIQKLQTISVLNSSADEEIEKTYKAYVDNYEIMDSSMKKIEGKAKELDECYTTAKNELEHNLQERKLLLELAFKDKKEKIIPAVRGMVDGFISKKPFDQCKGYQVSPLKDWDGISAPKQLAQHFLYLGKIHRQYTIFGQDYMVSRREYLELLNFQNLIIHFDNKNKEQCLSLVSTLVGRLLKATEGQQLQVHVVDPKHEMGLNDNFNHLSSELYEVYEVVTELDTADVQKQENGVLRMTKGKPVEKYIQSQLSGGKMLGYHVVVFQDWYATLDGRIDENELKGIVANSVKAGYCFIFMVNDDEKKNVESRHRVDDGEILSELPNCAKIILDGRAEQQLELMDGDQLFAVVQSVQQKYLPQPKDIDVGSFLEERRSLKQLPCKGGFSLFVGKDSTLRDKELRFEDDIIHQSLLVNYRKPSVFKWMNAMIAQAFTMYDPRELNVMVADFTGNKDIAMLAGGRNVVEPPFFYLGGNVKSSRNIGLQFPEIFLSFKDKQNRLLAFIIGSNEDFETNVVEKGFLDNDRLHFVLMTTDDAISDSRRKTLSFEGYQVSFGPRRIDNQMSHFRGNGISKTFSGEEFMYEDNVYQAYTYSVESTEHILHEYIKHPTPTPIKTPLLSGEETKKKQVDTLEEESNEINTEDNIVYGKETNRDNDINRDTVIIDKNKGMPLLDEEDNDGEELYGYEQIFKFPNLPKDKWWHDSCATSLEVPFGIHIDWTTGKNQELTFKFDDVDTEMNAAFILGGTGAGKSGVLNTLIIGAAQRYSPKELELYLIDLKNVGFLPYEKYKLPHVRVVASGDDPDFTISVLSDLGEEVERRKEKLSKETFPRTVVIVDECHLLFRKRDPVSVKAIESFEKILRQGRTLGMNVIFATQMLESSTTDIPRDLFDLVGTRIVSTPKDGFRKIFPGRDPSDAQKLNGYTKGEMMYVPKGKPLDLPIEDYHMKSYYIQYNDKKPEDDSELKDLIKDLAEYAKTHHDRCPKNIEPFEYHYDSDLVEFVARDRMEEEHFKQGTNLPDEIPMYLGTPIAVRDQDVYLTLVSEEFNNVLVIGYSDAPLGQGIAYQALSSSMIAYPVEGSDNHVAQRKDYIFDFTKSKKGELNPFSQKLSEEVRKSPFSPDVALIGLQKEEVLDNLNEIKALIADRMSRPQEEVKSHVYVTIFGLERGTMFGEERCRNKEETDLLCYILSNGPANGIFTIVQYNGTCEGLRSKIGKNVNVFKHVVALKTTDKLLPDIPLSNLYSSSAKISPGLYRAIYYNRDDSDYHQKFKPYKF